VHICHLLFSHSYKILSFLPGSSHCSKQRTQMSGKTDHRLWVCISQA
jgi:hypothetical protein